MQKIHYLFQHYMAKLAAPILRVTGYRFGKKWRGNVFINHVEANLMADGFEVQPFKF